MTNKEIGQRIADCRINQDLTMDDIAQRVGVAKSTIQRYEKGTIKKLKLPVIESIASALNVNPNWLIGNTDDSSPLPHMNSITKEQPPISEGLSNIKQELFHFVDELTDEQAALALRILKSIVEVQ